jgi:hypothetical protein
LPVSPPEANVLYQNPLNPPQVTGGQQRCGSPCFSSTEASAMRRLPDPDVDVLGVRWRFLAPLSSPPRQTSSPGDGVCCPVVSGGAAAGLAASVLSAMKIVDGALAAGSYFRYLGGYREEFDETNATLPSRGCLECVSVIVW